MIRCPKCHFLNAGDRPSICYHCGQIFVYHTTKESYISRRDDDCYNHVRTFGGFNEDKWNHEENRPNTFVEDAMKGGSSGGGGNTQSFASDPEPERQDDPDPPSDSGSDDE